MRLVFRDGPKNIQILRCLKLFFIYVKLNWVSENFEIVYVQLMRLKRHETSLFFARTKFFTFYPALRENNIPMNLITVVKHQKYPKRHKPNSGMTRRTIYGMISNLSVSTRAATASTPPCRFVIESDAFTKGNIESGNFRTTETRSRLAITAMHRAAMWRTALYG